MKNKFAMNKWSDDKFVNYYLNKWIDVLTECFGLSCLPGSNAYFFL